MQSIVSMASVKAVVIFAHDALCYWKMVLLCAYQSSSIRLQRERPVDFSQPAYSLVDKTAYSDCHNVRSIWSTMELEGFWKSQYVYFIYELPFSNVWMTYKE